MSNRVTRWLGEIGLGEHAESFVQNDIDFDLLTRLSAEDLKELGLSVGHRRRFLDAAAKLKESAPEYVGISSSTSRPRDEAERRQLTVMFCDLVGSTELSQKLDPEDLRKVNRAYQDACKAAIERFEGYIARYMGDGVLAYFGYPLAHEDDAERAIHAGLSVVDAIGSLNKTMVDKQGIELGVRVGMATGQVVVGDIIGEGASRESAVVGETPNLAARLQALAAPNTVVIGLGSHELAAGRFEYDDLGTYELKGIAEPVQAWRVIAPAAVESRFEAAHQTGLTPLVGREHEIGLLLDRWEQAREGDGQVVLLSGEAGIGKSRITQTLRERTARDDLIRVRYQCSPYHTNSALYPVIKQLERAAQIESNEASETKFEKLTTLLAQSTREVELVAPLLATLLSIPTKGRYAPLELTAERQKQKTLDALVAQMEGLSRHRPVLLIFEDVHWADPTSLELLELIVEQAQEARVLVLITFRPEFTPPWVGHTHITSLVLNRFSRNLVTAMVDRVTGGKRLPDEVRNQIVEKTDGVPLFVEELTKTILEMELLVAEADRYVLAGPLSAAAIPATLHDSLMARLDRLGAVKEIAQRASAIGREFDYDLLAAVSSLSFRELQDALNQLVDAELVFRRSRSHRVSYVFKHALVRDAAYESLLKTKRQELHAHIAEVLDSRFPERAETEPELLAHHYGEAGLTEPAIACWRKAGLRAIDTSANVEAVSHLTKGLALFVELSDCGERPNDELSLQAPLATALTAAKGYAAPETGKALMRSRDLCGQIGDSPKMFEVLYGVWNYFFVGGDLHAARELAEECLELAQNDGERKRTVAAHGMLGQTLVSMGHFDASHTHLERSIDLYESEEDRELWHVYGEDPAMACLPWLQWILWFKGFPEQALARSHEALEMTRQSSDMVTAGWALSAEAVLRYLRREPDATQEVAQATIDFATEQNLPVFIAYGTMLRGWALTGQGQPEEGVAQMHLGLKKWRATGTKMFVPLFLDLLAQGYAKFSEFREALKLLNEAFDAARHSGEDMWESELQRHRGMFLLAVSSKNAPEAAKALHQAIEAARRQNSRSLELRAATSLARLWQEQGKLRNARDLLEPVYSWFTEGFDTPDLIEAKGLLKQLA